MLQIGIMKEGAPTERRVALVPESAARLAAAGCEVVFEHDAGYAAGHPDSAYEGAGATALDPAGLESSCEAVVCVRPPDPARVARLRGTGVLIGLLEPSARPDLLAACATAGVTAVSLDLLPRTLSRAQAMDALTSQAVIAGYRAAILAAATYQRFFPMLMTAAGTVRPARVLVLGAGVAGLSAIGTARRLGADVTGYDVRLEAAGTPAR